MLYTLSQNQLVSRSGSNKDIATVIIPPFRCQSLSIDFFCELAETLSYNSTCYHMDYSYMRKGHAKEYVDCLPSQEISQVLELVSDISKSHTKINLVGMCLGAAFAIYLSNIVLVNKLVGLSIVDLENFRDFLIGRVNTNTPVDIMPLESGEQLVITLDRVDWYSNKKTQELLRAVNTPALFIGYDNDPYVYPVNRREISDVIQTNENCRCEILVGMYHRLGNDKEFVFDHTRDFLFNTTN